MARGMSRPQRLHPDRCRRIDSGHFRSGAFGSLKPLLRSREQLSRLASRGFPVARRLNHEKDVSDDTIYALTVAGPRRAFLLSLDDALADEPVGRGHDRIDRAGGCTPRVLDRTHNVGEEIVVAGHGPDRPLLYELPRSRAIEAVDAASLRAGATSGTELGARPGLVGSHARRAIVWSVRRPDTVRPKPGKSGPLDSKSNLGPDIPE